MIPKIQDDLGRTLSQEALAERMGVDRAYISWIETGRQNATLLSLWHASQALDVRPAALLDETHVAATVAPGSEER
jgi:transcriptional regulator with XRE-family HTH domain